MLQLSTGEGARFIGAREPKLNALIRRGAIDPAPRIVGGRRLWGPEHLLQAAENLGLLTDELRDTLSQEVSNAS